MILLPLGLTKAPQYIFIRAKTEFTNVNGGFEQTYALLTDTLRTKASASLITGSPSERLRKQMKPRKVICFALQFIYEFSLSLCTPTSFSAVSHFKRPPSVCFLLPPTPGHYILISIYVRLFTPLNIE